MRNLATLVFVITIIFSNSILADVIHQNTEKKFLDIFHSKNTGFHVVSDEVTTFMASCCVSKEDAIYLLQESGFTLEIVNEQNRVSNLNNHWETQQINYEEFIFGERKPGFLRFWKLFTKYKVTLMLKNDRVLETYAVIDTTYP